MLSPDTQKWISGLILGIVIGVVSTLIATAIISTLQPKPFIRIALQEQIPQNNHKEVTVTIENLGKATSRFVSFEITTDGYLENYSISGTGDVKTWGGHGNYLQVIIEDFNPGERLNISLYLKGSDRVHISNLKIDGKSQIVEKPIIIQIGNEEEQK